MSEIAEEGFDAYSAPGMYEAVLELQEKYGVEPEEAEQGVQLAIAMHGVLYDYKQPKKKLSKRGLHKEIKRLYAEAAANLPDLIR